MENSNSLQVAIWMVTYNHEAYIEQAVASVMMQETNFKYHLYIGEDCSTDQTTKLCKTLQERYPDTITLVLNDTNLGATTNGLQMYDKCLQSGATYIAMLEGDDYWTDPLKLQKQVDFLELHPKLSFAMTRFSALLDDHTYHDYNAHFFKELAPITFDFNMFTKGWYGGTLTLVFRSLAINIETIKQYKYFRDIYLYTELLKVGNGVCLNFNSGVYRKHETGIYSSASPLERLKTAVLCYDELFKKNTSINALRIKYYYFANQYIKQLVATNHILKAISETLKFAFKMKDFGFVIKIIKHLIKSNILTAYFKSVFKKNNPNKNFINSKQYWEDRYVSNRNSGAGSYGRLVDFKAQIINQFVKDNNLSTIIEFGCGDGHQLSLARYPNYVGFDVSEKALNICRKKFKKDVTKSFFSIFDDTKKYIMAELTLSLDVIYHLVEDKVFHDYMTRLFNSSNQFVIIYSSNYESYLAKHVRCRQFTDWISKHVADDWELQTFIRNKYPFDASNPNHTSMADFYIYKKLD